ncbi:GGDEF domain-containing protein [Thalassotalea insulae]|uniref:GGDEF domain-containing protein n=1 Tax=Thalassotalea insulae TaxID=2056778 RepID=UPI0024E17D29|nr:tetratricopeptide repeat-containing diguanylate cyclase [Thalassotalea insulae]
MLISCKVYAEQANNTAINNGNFSQFVANVEKLQGQNLNQAFLKLDAQRSQLANLSVKNQLIFYRLLAEVYVEQAQYQKSKEVATQGISLAMTLASSDIVTAELLYARGFAVESLGNYQAARQDYLNGIEIADSLNDKKIVAMGLTNLGALDYLTEQFEHSLTMFNDALAIAKKLNDDELSGFVYSELGILYSLISQEDKSLIYYQKSYEHYLKAGKTFYAYNTLSNMASNHAASERYEEAIPLFKEVIDHAEQIGNDELISSAYSGMAWAQAKQKDSDPEASYHYMLLASQYAENAQQADFPIAHALDKGYLFKELGKTQEALESMLKAEQLLKQYNNHKQKMVSTISQLNVLYLKAELYHQLKEHKQAYLAQEQFLTIALALPEKSNFEEVEDLRMRYESEQADIEKKILEHQESVQTLKLSEAKSDAENRQLFSTTFAIVVLVLAWLLVKTLKGQKKLLIASRTDELTGVTNRRRLIELGEKFVKRAWLNKQPFSLIVLDIDDFKEINDSLGHKVGDQTLQQVAQVGQQLVGDKGVFGRLGGEEFIVLLPVTTIASAIELAELLRLTISRMQWAHNEIEKVTVSVGIASTVSSEIHGFDQLLQRADRLMYQAKRQGKNKVCSSE